MLLNEGAELVFGRSENCDLLVGLGPGHPEDRMVSARAGMLKWHSGLLWVLNTSTYMPFYLFAGTEEQVVVPKEVFSTVVRRTRLELRGKSPIEGRRQEAHRIDVRLPYDEVEGGSAASGSGTEGLLHLEPRERLLLTAYCYRLLNFSGPQARPASHNEAGDRLGISPKTARREMDDLRSRLSTDYGVPGLLAAEEDKFKEDGTVTLCRYAVRSGNITEDDFSLLEHWEKLRQVLQRVDRAELGLSRSGDWPAYLQLTKLLAEKNIDRGEAIRADVDQLLVILQRPPL
ncbi:MAG: hypothetical protein WKF86_03420 [Acidimicrobiales bacterium]